MSDITRRPCYDQLIDLAETRAKRFDIVEEIYVQAVWISQWKKIIGEVSYKEPFKIVSERRQKYKVDRENWLTSANFVNVYGECTDQMV